VPVTLSARLGTAINYGAAALIVSTQVAICAAAPEFIWSGLLVVLAHPSWGDLVSALLIGVNLAFFVEPAMERLHDWLSPTEHAATAAHRPRNLLFTAGLSLAFAVVSVCLHDAMVAFVSGRGGEDAHTAIAAGIMLIAGWAFVPFAVTLAWQSSGCRLLAVPSGVIAAASPGLAGWLFSWPLHEVMTTAVPCWLILGFGYRQLAKAPDGYGFTRCWRIVALVGALWLAGVVLVDAMLGLFQTAPWKLYEARLLFIDLRFYLGWTIGLALAPLADRRSADASHSG
jgi:hypothetical protein